MKSELVPLNGDPPIAILRDVTVIGRREFCDVQIDHPSLSKRHCVLVRTEGLLMLRDLATTNGTKVNGQRVMWAALLPNDKITLGNYKLRVYLGSDEAISPCEEAERKQAVLAGERKEQKKQPSHSRSEFPTPGPEDDSPPPDVVRFADGRSLNLADIVRDAGSDPLIDLD